MADKDPIVVGPDGKPTYERGKRYPAWALIAIPFIFLIPFLIKKCKDVCWRSVFCTIFVFQFLLLFVEHNSIMKGHWVYNKARILGPTIWQIPIEEPLIYYLFPPVLVILLFHFFINVLQSKNPKKI